MKRKGFTLIELLVVIAIIGLLSTLAVVSLNSARAKARDARRLSDVKQLSTILEMESTSNPASTALTCGAATTFHSDASSCTAPGEVSQFENFNDPSMTGICLVGDDECDYSISNEAGTAAPAVDDYEICFVLEQASGGLTAGLNAIQTGGVFDNCYTDAI